METSLTRSLWKVLEDPEEVHTGVEDAEDVHTYVEGCGRMWKDVEGCERVWKDVEGFFFFFMGKKQHVLTTKKYSKTT